MAQLITFLLIKLLLYNHSNPNIPLFDLSFESEGSTNRPFFDAKTGGVFPESKILQFDDFMDGGSEDLRLFDADGTFGRFFEGISFRV